MATTNVVVKSYLSLRKISFATTFVVARSLRVQASLKMRATTFVVAKKTYLTTTVVVAIKMSLPYIVGYNYMNGIYGNNICRCKTSQSIDTTNFVAEDT